MAMRFKKIFFLSSFLLSVYFAALFLPFFRVLALEAEDSGKLVAYIPLRDARFFQIHYIHSIHKSPVVESFRIEDGQMILHRLEYREFAVGMPSEAEDGAQYEIKDGKMILYNLHRSFSHLDLRIAQVTPEHHLIVQGKSIPFTSVARPGSWIRIKVRSICLWQIIRGVNLI